MIDIADQDLIYTCQLFMKYGMRLFCENNKLYGVLVGEEKRLLITC